MVVVKCEKGTIEVGRILLSIWEGTWQPEHVGMEKKEETSKKKNWLFILQKKDGKHAKRFLGQQEFATEKDVVMNWW